MNSKLLIIILFVSYLISCKKDLVDGTWAYYNETQCANPWDLSKLTGTEPRVKEYLENNSIQVFEVKIETFSRGPFCHACTCSSGRKISVKILGSDLEAIRNLGFY
jgi:hypothetical protein